jgi:23S rRNA pseudouridine1911/1915/1917 synthase
MRTFTIIHDLVEKTRTGINSAVGTKVDDRADKLIVSLLEENDEVESISRSQVQKLIEDGHIKVNGNTIRTKDKIAPGAEIEISIPSPTEISVEAENIPLQILYEDEHLIVVNKQPNLTVHPSETQKNGTLVNALMHHVKDLSGIGGKLRPGIVHRIDKDTSGALVITKTDLAHAGLSKQFAAHTIERRYWAYVYGSPKWDEEIRFISTLDRSPSDRKKMAVNVEGGRTAISRFTRLEAYGIPAKIPFAALIEAKLETGRTHQVRVHLNHLGHSLFGDKVYGVTSDHQPKWKAIPHDVQTAIHALPGQALHARVLGFIHPVTGESLRFEAEPYVEFRNLAEALKKYR